VSDIIAGRNPVTEAIRAGRDFDRICFANGDKTLQRIIDMAKDRRIPIDFVDRSRLDALSYTKDKGMGCILRVYPDGKLLINDFAKNEILETSVEDFLGYYEDEEEEECDCGCGGHHHHHDHDTGMH